MIADDQPIFQVVLKIFFTHLEEYQKIQINLHCFQLTERVYSVSGSVSFICSLDSSVLALRVLSSISVISLPENL